MNTGTACKMKGGNDTVVALSGKNFLDFRAELKEQDGNQPKA
jgi:hypothetical protein